MASSFLEQLAKEQAEKIDKEHGASAYGGTAWLKKQLGNKDDIAPVKEQEERTWFKSSSYFDDGWDFGDVAKTILGSAGDVGQDLLTGVVGIGEKLADAGVTAGGWLSTKTVGLIPGMKNSTLYKHRAAQLGKEVSDFVSEDLYDEEEVTKKYILPYDVEDESVLGEKSDALAQSGGQLVAQIGVNTLLPGSGMALMGATAFGSEAENALRTGATLEEAALSGLISAGAEMLTEQIFGGIKFGGKTLDDALTKRIASTISNKIVRTLAKTGMDMAGEGAEEIVSGYASAIGQKLTYMSEKELNELFSSEDALESFIGGAVLGGFSNVTKNIASNKKGIDPVTGLTKNEQKVLDKLVADEIAEAEKNGKVTAKQKAEIRDKILAKMEKGYVSIDDIESVLGGETYKTYKNTLDSENALTERQEALQKELDDINNSPWQERDWDRIDEIEAELAEINPQVENNKANSKLGDIRKQLGDEVFQMTAKDKRLRESYNEALRKYQQIDIDPTQYSGAARKTAESIVNAKWNNTNVAKDAANLLIRVSEDQGIPIEALTAKEIAERGFGVEGKTVNGANTKDGIIINWQSKKYLNTTVGHEITHVLKKSGLYEPLRDAMKAYSEAKGDYQTRYDSTKDLYTKKDKDGNAILDADGNSVYLTEDGNVDGIEEEVIADLVGDYLFTDQKFVDHLLSTDENVFKKVWNEVKYFVKISTAGSEEHGKLLEAQRAFERAYKNRSKNPDGETTTGTQYSLLVKDKNGNVSTVNPYVTTREQSMEYMVKSRKGELNQYTYFPVRAHTPGTIIETLNNAGIGVTDKPLAMQAKKARQSQIEGQHTEPDGTVIRHHAMSTEEIQETIDKLNEPFAVIHQTERTKTIVEDGKKVRVPAPDNFVFFVTLSSGKECVAVIEFDSIINEDMIQKDGQGDDYHTTVTVFEPDQYRDGESFDYLEYLSVKPSNYELEVKKESSKTETAISQTEATVSAVELSSTNVAQKGSDVKGQNSLSDIGEQPVQYGDWNIYGEDLALQDIAPVNPSVDNVEAVGENVAVSEAETVAPVAEKATSHVLYSGRDGKNGWGKVYATAQEALNDAVKSVNPGLWDAIDEEIENSVGVKNADTPMVNALIAVQEDVRQSTITPMQGAQLLSEAYIQGEANALRGLYNPKTGNLYDRYLEEAKQYESTVSKQTAEDVEGQIAPHTDADAPMDDIAPVKEQPVKEAYEAIRPKREQSNEPRMVKADSKGKQRKWVGTSTDSEAVDGKVLPKDLDQDLIHYQPISNKKTLGNANSKLNNMGYEASLTYMNSQFASNKVTLDDIALGERLIQEAVKRGDTKTAGDLIMDISILGTELGQKVQALSIIKRLTPEGQLRMLQKAVERGKTKGDKAFEGVEITQDMIDHILKTYGKDGTYDQAELNKRVEDVKQQIADQMKVTAMDYINEWRYLAMLGNPKTHIRNIVSNVAMWGTRQIKDAFARSLEGIAPVKERTKIWKRASKDVKAYAKQATDEMYEGETDNKYSEAGSIKAKRQILPGVIGKASDVNSKFLSGEDTFFSKPAYRSALSEFLTANGITTKADIEKNPKIVAKAKAYAMDQAKAATFQQDSYIASKISEIERKNPLLNVAVGSVLPFKKTPINVAKTAVSYSPLGFAKSVYAAVQVSKGNMEASEAIDHLAQALTGTSLTLIGYALASAGILNGAGEDDKEGEYDYQLGEQSYSFNFNGDTISLSWLSPVAMPLFVGANAYEQLVAKEDWNWNVVSEALAQTLDPLSEMSFLSSLADVLSSYDSGMAAFGGMIESAGQSYITSFVPTLSSQIAQVTDDTKRSTKISANSGFDFGEETWNKIKYKIPVLRQTLEPTTDIWGNEVKQSENFLTRAFESFIAPYARRENIATEIDEEIKDLYSQTGNTGLIPQIPKNYVSYDGVKYNMSAEEFTDFKKDYGQTSFDLIEQLFATETYRNADSETKADMVNKVYDYASDLGRKNYFAKQGIYFTNATKDGKEIYKEDPIKGAIKADMPVDEYVFSEENPSKYSFFKKNGITYEDYDSADEDGKRAYTWAYENPDKFVMSKAVAGDVVTYRKYTGKLYDIKADKDSNGKAISGSRKEKVIKYINNLDLDYGQKIMLFKSEYESDDTYNNDIVEYLNSRNDISFEDMKTILEALGAKVDSKGNIKWD